MSVDRIVARQGRRRILSSDGGGIRGGVAPGPLGAVDTLDEMGNLGALLGAKVAPEHFARVQMH